MTRTRSGWSASWAAPTTGSLRTSRDSTTWLVSGWGCCWCWCCWLLLVVLLVCTFSQGAGAGAGLLFGICLHSESSQLTCRPCSSCGTHDTLASPVLFSPGVCCVLCTLCRCPLPTPEEVNREKGWAVAVHVDAASGGFIAPFLYPDLEWDFRLPNVKSINVSGHK